jgi:hypothetical protein
VASLVLDIKAWENRYHDLHRTANLGDVLRKVTLRTSDRAAWIVGAPLTNHLVSRPPRQEAMEEMFAIAASVEAKGVEIVVRAKQVSLRLHMAEGWIVTAEDIERGELASELKAPEARLLANRMKGWGHMYADLAKPGPESLRELVKEAEQISGGVFDVAMKSAWMKTLPEILALFQWKGNPEQQMLATAFDMAQQVGAQAIEIDPAGKHTGVIHLRLLMAEDWRVGAAEIREGQLPMALLSPSDAQKLADRMEKWSQVCAQLTDKVKLVMLFHLGQQLKVSERDRWIEAIKDKAEPMLRVWDRMTVPKPSEESSSRRRRRSP